jgi:hypothetical protein
MSPAIISPTINPVKGERGHVYRLRPNSNGRPMKSDRQIVYLRTGRSTSRKVDSALRSVGCLYYRDHFTAFRRLKGIILPKRTVTRQRLTFQPDHNLSSSSSVFIHFCPNNIHKEIIQAIKSPAQECVYVFPKVESKDSCTGRLWTEGSHFVRKQRLFRHAGGSLDIFYVS